ncbi:MAG: MlaD family protein [Prolixibacteraceae bacterium]|jgi:phospholipid/cholesterol/gamma-HCH transport system substrate-binding protein|nr:MCE family protein [Prolixibacteraceae bacterium]MDI9565119.1 MlaD family protein [Bacteroidota bacterium]NLS99307.1 MCE family protein [Bacteroidales bacterium]OQB81286.1 MAG: mce related protein [Bacteroidetes bacterium ADurb.Bin123]HNZ69404.1 MlaD family protein [Prolixibacteraceae bacterium]
MKLSKYVKLGILMVFTIFVLIWGLSYLKGHDFFKPVDYYYSRYERVDGLQESSLVTVNGYRVGNVKDIRFANDKSGDLIVTFMIDNDFRIPVKSIARIVSSDIMGSRSVKLVFSGEEAYYQAGDTIPGEIESDLKEQVSMQVLPLKYKAEELLSTLDSAITVLTVIFNEDAREDLAESFENINRTINNLELTSADLQQLMSAEKSNLGRLIRNMEGFSSTLNNNSAHFDNIITKLAAITDTLASQPLTPLFADLSDAVNSIHFILKKVNSDQSSAGLLLNDDELYNNLTGLTTNLELLLADIRSNPKKYIHFSAFDFGKQVYINSPESDASGSQSILYRIRLITSRQQLPPESTLFEKAGVISEMNINGEFTYFSGEYAYYADAEKARIILLRNFPDATVVPFRNGKIIPLERALRLQAK